MSSQTSLLLFEMYLEGQSAVCEDTNGGINPSFATDSGNYKGIIASQKSGNLVYAVGGAQPFTKELKFNPESGQMFMRYCFNKNDEEYTYEKTQNVLDKSEQQRQKIITDFEKEIELPGEIEKL